MDGGSLSRDRERLFIHTVLWRGSQPLSLAFQKRPKGSHGDGQHLQRKEGRFWWEGKLEQANYKRGSLWN